jgi:hypothetical protein
VHAITVGAENDRTLAGHLRQEISVEFGLLLAF